MAKTRLVSGNLKIEVAYSDKGSYNVRLCPIRKSYHGGACARVKVNPPRFLRRGVDSPAAIRDAARAAISFAPDRIQEQAAMDAQGSGWVVRSPRNIRGPRRRRR